MTGSVKGTTLLVPPYKIRSFATCDPGKVHTSLDRVRGPMWTQPIIQVQRTFFAKHAEFEESGL